MEFSDQEVKINLVSKESERENLRKNYFSLKTFSEFKCLHNFNTLDVGNPQHILYSVQNHRRDTRHNGIRHKVKGHNNVQVLLECEYYSGGLNEEIQYVFTT